MILDCDDTSAAEAALEAIAASKPILNGANAANYAEMSALATKYGVVLGVSGANLDELHDTVAALENAGNKNLIIDVTGADIKETFANAVEVRRAALKNQDRTFGYPSIVNLHDNAEGDTAMQTALASVFTLSTAPSS